MLRRLVLPLILGLAGTAVLIGLGVWQLQRLAWKEEMLARIGTAIAAAPVEVPPEGQGAEFLSVTATGTLAGPALRFVYSATDEALVTVLDTGTRRLLLDPGLAPNGTALPEGGTVTVTGNLEQPQGTGTLHLDQPNARAARDLSAMADLLDAEPVLVVARDITPAIPGVTPLPVTTDGIPNNHFGYAIQWFALAAVWAAMSAGFAWRQSRPDHTRPDQARPDQARPDEETS